MSVKNKTKKERREIRESKIPNYQNLPVFDTRENSREATEKFLKGFNLPQSKYFKPSESVIGLSYNLSKAEIQTFKSIFLNHVSSI